MARQRARFGFAVLTLLVVLLMGGAGCRTCAKAPCFTTDAAVITGCDGQSPGNHDITVDDQGGVGVGKKCVVIGRKAGNWVKWVPQASGKEVTIVFVLKKDQPVPFQHMSCGSPDKQGNRLCVLLNCPGDCKTSFLAGYTPSPQPNDPINYYFYSPGVSSHGMGAKSGAGGSDPGIRIDP